MSEPQPGRSFVDAVVTLEVEEKVDELSSSELRSASSLRFGGNRWGDMQNQTLKLAA